MKANTNRNQLELGLGATAPVARQPTPRGRRLARARWWFEQMHAVVDRALDWAPAPPARPEQTYLGLAQAR